MSYWNFNSSPTQLQHYFHAFSCFLNISPTHAIHQKEKEKKRKEMGDRSSQYNTMCVCVHIYVQSKLDTVLYHIIESLRWGMSVGQIMADGVMGIFLPMRPALQKRTCMKNGYLEGIENILERLTINLQAP
jgi:hypothetical protein